jgi:copper(I)-binding protein
MTRLATFQSALGRFLCTVSLLLISAPAATEGVTVDQAWARASPPGVDKAAAYFRLTVADEAPADRLVAIRSPARGRASLHATVTRDGQTRMEAVDGVALVPGETVAFEPGGRHVMITDLETPSRAGERLLLVLQFANRGEREVRVPVRPLNASGP